jgi:glycosyltransferase involved in cell wall biosynthesis
MPTYNCADKIEKTIQSVLAQDKELYEFIIVDGQSTDKTMEIVKSHQDNLSWVSEKDNGIYDAMNKGIDLARGKYLFFLGAGDILRKDILKQIKADLLNSKYNFIYGNAHMIHRGRIYIHNGQYDKYKLAKSNICHQSIFYEKSIFELIGKYELKYKAKRISRREYNRSRI